MGQETDGRSDLLVVFEAVEIAEKQGGEVSELVDELNLIIRLVEAGDSVGLSEVESRIVEVLSQAPIVGDMGARRVQFMRVKVGVLLGLLLASAVLVWRFGPRVFWSAWIRSKRGWRVYA